MINCLTPYYNSLALLWLAYVPRSLASHVILILLPKEQKTLIYISAAINSSSIISREILRLLPEDVASARGIFYYPGSEVHPSSLCFP
jgi:hypothetical protein